MDETYLPSPEKVGGVIPHFFFDLIGRITPGTLFVAAMTISVWDVREIERYIRTSPQFNVSGAAVAFLLFLLLSYVAGFLLGALSYVVFEGLRKWTMADLREWYGFSRSKPAPVEGAFEKQFLYSIIQCPAADPSVRNKTQSRRIVRASWLCAYYIWARSYNLGILTSRWDAEALAARNLAVAALIPLVYQLFCHRGPWQITLLAILAAMGSYGYNYHRKKQLFGRFDLFMSLGEIARRESEANRA